MSLDKPPALSAVAVLAAVALVGSGSSACRQAESQPLSRAAPPLPAQRITVGPLPGGSQPQPMANPLADDRVALTEGRRLFVDYNCYGCHGGHGGGGMGPSLRDPEWIYGGDAPHIYDSIAEGRAHGMPAWGTRLPAEQVWQLTAYIQSLGTRLEPEAPQ
jgi:cytochrome c oxidase cbb3-type subunit III